MNGNHAGQEYIDRMVRDRGYVLEYHKVLAAQDFEVLQKANELINAAYLHERNLARWVKELIFVVSLIVARAPKTHIQSHIRVALSLGVTPETILEAIEIALPEAGVVAFQSGVEAWQEVVQKDTLEPSVPAQADGGDRDET